MVRFRAVKSRISAWFVVVLATALLAACSLGRPLEEQHPSIQRAPGSVDDSTEAKHDALARTAGADLGCAQIELVLTLERRYANTASARYVVEGCGTRALYAETCESYPSCRYLLLSTVAVPHAAGSTLVPISSAPPTPPAASAAPLPSVAPASSAPTAAPSASAPGRYL